MYLFLAFVAITQQQSGPHARLELQHCLLSTSSIQCKQRLQTQQDEDDQQHCIALQLDTSKAATAFCHVALMRFACMWPKD